MLYVGEGLRGSNGTCSTLCQFSVTPSATHNQSGPFWCCFPSGWACAHTRPVWVSPMTSPMRLGVSPTAALTPPGVFTQRFEALFPHAGTLGCMVCRRVHQLMPRQPAAALPTRLHNPPHHLVLQLPPCHESSLPRLPVSAPLTCLDECFFFFSLVVGLLYSSIFCQFWLVFVFKLVLSFFWLCEEAQCVYLHLHLG